VAGIVPNSISTGTSDGDGCSTGTITDIAIYTVTLEINAWLKNANGVNL